MKLTRLNNLHTHGGDYYNANEVEDALREILAVIKPICPAVGYELTTQEQADKFFTLVAELEALNGKQRAD